MGELTRHTGWVTNSVRWRLVVPVKEAHLAKTRLVAPTPVSRPELARALALDTLHAVCRALPPEDVYVVTSDQVVRGVCAAWGVSLVPDPGKGLNAAVQRGIAAARESFSGSGSGREPVAVGVLLGDLPALRPEDLLVALAACGQHEQAVVPDLSGTGTVLLTATGGTLPDPSFGPGSAARHAEVATVLPLDLPRLRQDVDDLPGLAAAVSLGVGTRTAQLVSPEGPHERTAN